MRVRLPVTNIKLERLLISVLAVALAIKSYSLHFHDLGFDRMAFRDYIARAALNGWLNSDWFVGGNNTWVPTFSQWPLLLLESIFGTYLGGLVLAILVSLCTAHVLFSIYQQLTSKRKISKLSGFIAISISTLSPYWLGELGTSYENSLTTPIVLFGVLNLLKFNTNSEQTKLIWIASFSLTFATTIKMTNIVFLVPGLMLLFFVIALNIKSIKQKATAMISVFAGTSLGLSIIIPWWIYTFQKMRNPIFPFFNTVFHSPYYPNENWRDTRWMMQSVFDLKSLISGWRLGPAMSELPVVDARLPIVFGILGILVIRKIDSSKFKNLIFMPISTGALLQLWMLFSVLLWAKMLFYARYLQPIELLLGLLIIYYLSYLFVSKKIINSLGVVIIMISAASIQIPNWGSNSEGSLFGGAQERWASPLTTEVSKLNGVLLTTGATGFLRQTSPGISNMINLDSYLLPQKFSLLVQQRLVSGETVHFVSQGAANEPQKLQSRIYEIFGTETMVTCKDSEGPIYGPFVVCEIRKA